jgi:phage replication O-like protein O
MTPVQKENGYTAIANEIIRSLCCSDISGGELKLVLILIRKTYGFHKVSDTISRSQFSKELGISENAVKTLLKRLIKKNIIIKLKEGRGKGNLSSFKYNKYYDTWKGVTLFPFYNEPKGVKLDPQKGSPCSPTKEIYTKENIIAKAIEEKLLVKNKKMDTRYVACDAEGNEGTLSPKGKFRVKHTTPFSWEKRVDEMKNSPIAVHRTIILYWLTKGWKFDNWGQYDKALLREIRPAKELNDYDLAEIKKGIKYCKDKFEDKWTLETVAKWMPEALKVKKEILL